MDEKRTICGYEVQFALHVGPREVVLLLDPKSDETPYMVGYCDIIPGWGAEQLKELEGSEDYLEVVDEFLSRVQEQVKQVYADREKQSDPLAVFGMEHCLPGGLEQDINNCVVVLKPDVLRPEYRNVANQLLLVEGGSGSKANAYGTAVFAKTIFSGESHNCRRHQVLGVLDPAKAPDWVKPGVEAIRAQHKEKGGKSHER